MVFYEYFYICLHGRLKTSKQRMLPIISSITLEEKAVTIAQFIFMRTDPSLDYSKVCFKYRLNLYSSERDAYLMLMEDIVR